LVAWCVQTAELVEQPKGAGAPPEHACHFYVEENELATTVATFLSPAFVRGQAIVAIGTPSHLSAIERRLRTVGHDIDAARTTGQYVPLDAAWTLRQLMVHGLPTSERFDAVIGTHLERLERAHGGVRAFGEIVNLLWRDGKYQAALKLEDIWNEALGYRPLALVCGYSMGAFREAARPGLSRVLTTHTKVTVQRTDA
jgi:hypothetical protein